MTEHIQPSASDEISLKDMILKIKEWIAYLKDQWWKIAIAGLVGGVIGFGYASIQPVTYTAKTTFVVEDAKSGPSLGGLASLAGQFGVDVGGGSSSSLLSTDNIIVYFKSVSLAKQVLLTPYDSSNQKSLADVYCQSHGLLDKWKNDEKIGPKISFPPYHFTKIYSRTQDSLLDIVINHIIKKQFIISRVDKKSSFFEVYTTMQDEKLAKIYSDELVKKAVTRYILTKTQRQKNAIEKLQFRADSIANLLYSQTSKAASIQVIGNTMDINPLYKIGTNVEIETSQRNKSMLAAIYTEVVKNLEVARFSLTQETPTIQIIDEPNYPLLKVKVSKFKTVLVWSWLFSFLMILYFLLKKFLKNR
jgi:hypothetical protein